MIHEHSSTLRDCDHRTGVLFKCGRCRKVITIEPKPNGGGTGYGYDTRIGHGQVPICYDCCGKMNVEDMKADGTAVLYLDCPTRQKPIYGHLSGTLSNWPGTYKVPCTVRVGGHNIAGVQYRVSFTGPDGKQWYGIQYGNNTQICRCRRKKSG